MPQVVVKAELLIAIARWAHPHVEDRPNLSAVYFRSREIVSTDGHRLVRVPHECHGLEFSVGRGDLFAAVAAQNAYHRHHNEFAMRLDVDLEAGNDGETIWALGDREIGIEWDGGAFVSMHLGGPVLRCPTGTGTLPQIDAVMLPRRDGDVPWGQGFDVRYLAGIEDVVRAAGYSREGVSIEGWEDTRLSKFQFSAPMNAPADERIRFVVMPIARNHEEARRENERRRGKRR